MRAAVLRVSLGGWFELYDLFMTAYLALGMIRERLFLAAGSNPFAFNEFASFVAAGFAGMFFGTIAFGWVSDRFGRRTTFTISLLWYSAATLAMALSRSAAAIDAWRFVAGLGIGVQLITIDAYVSELVPKERRGYWIAFTQFVGYTAVPVAALLAYVLVPRAPLGLPGWRYVALVGSLGLIAVWFLRSGLPESARWAASRAPAVPLRTVFAAPYRRRTIMMIAFNLVQTIGFYGFTAWVPIFLASEGVGFVRSLEYTFFIAIINPLGPLLAMTLADSRQRKWQIVWLSLFIAAAGIAFSQARHAAGIIALGAAITLANAWFSCAFHAYQAELFPTAVRARAVGFVYSWSRFSSIFVGFLIAWLLRGWGTTGAFAAIAAAMVIAAACIGAFGPLTNRRDLDELSPV